MAKKQATHANGNGCQAMTTQKTARRQASGLTPRQARFVKEYLVDLNGTQAAIRAGYSEKTAQTQSSRLLSNVMVSAAVEAGAATQHAQLDLTAQKVLSELLGVGYAEVASTDVRVSDKLRALELLAKHLGLLTEQVDHKHDAEALRRADTRGGLQ